MKKQKGFFIFFNVVLFHFFIFGETPFSKMIIDNNALSGIITDEKDKSPLIGAVVYIHDLKLGTTTDVNGAYNMSGLPKGTFLVEFSFVGYKTINRNITIDGDTHLDLALSESAIEQSEVVVTGLSKATQSRRSPIPILSAKREYLETHLQTNIIDGIAKLPGVSAVTTGPNVSKPFIRGLGYNRILTLFDGVRQEGQQWGDEHGIEVDQYSIDHIEVVKGPASLSYGSDALAGVVNLIPTPTAPDGKIVGNVLSEYHTNNGLIGMSGILGGYNNGFEWQGRLSHKQATNYRNSLDGRVYGTGFSETDASASLGLHKKWGYSHLQLALYNNEQEIPDGSRDSASRQFTFQNTNADTSGRPIVPESVLTDYSINKIHQLVQHYRAALNNNFIVGDGQLNVNVSYQRSVRREYNHPENPDVAGLYLQLNTVGYDVKYAFPEKNNWNVVSGINGLVQNNTVTSGTEFVIPSYNQFDAGVFTFAKKTAGKLDVSGGVRLDTRAFSNEALFTKEDLTSGLETVVAANTPKAKKIFAAQDFNFSGLSGSLGLTYNFSNAFALKFNVARGYRAPNISEITANGVHPGTNIYQIGNANFKPEFSLQEDVGIVYASNTVSASLSLFNNNLDNYIFNQKLNSNFGGDSIIVEGNQTFKFQQGTAHLYGGEFTLDFHPVAELHFENSISMVYGNNISNSAETDSTHYLPFVPPLRGTSELRYTTNFNASHITNAFVYGELVYSAAQNRVFSAYNTETPTSGYVLTNMGVGATFQNKKKNPVLSVTLLANNIFDVAYQEHLSRLKYFEPYPSATRSNNGIYNMGRNFAVKLSVPLGWNVIK